MINIIQTQHIKELKPKLSELNNVIVIRFVLLQHRTHNRSNAQHGQQAHRKAHRAEQVIKFRRCRFRCFQDYSLTYQ